MLGRGDDDPVLGRLLPPLGRPPFGDGAEEVLGRPLPALGLEVDARGGACGAAEGRLLDGAGTARARAGGVDPWGSRVRDGRFELGDVAGSRVVDGRWGDAAG